MNPILQQLVRRLTPILRHTGRHVWYLSAVLLVILAILFSVARALLSDIAERKHEIETYLSNKTSYTVRIQQLGAYWDGLYPGVHIQGMEVIPPNGAHPVIRLEDVRLSISLIPLLWSELQINSLVLNRPRLKIERAIQGQLRVMGIELPDTDIASSDPTFIGWMLQQKKLVIHDGELIWRDQREHTPLRLQKVDLILRNNGNSHHIGVSAVFPSHVCSECSLIADISGNPLVGNEWGGEIYLRAAGLDVETLPMIMRERLPKELRGKFDMRLWTDWDNSLPERVYGEGNVSELVLPMPEFKDPLIVRTASGDLDWKTKGRGWQLDLRRLTVGLSNAPWLAESLRFTRTSDAHTLQIKHVNLDDLSTFAARLRNDHPALKLWNALEPRGALNNLKLQLAGASPSSDGFSVTADVEQLRTRAHHHIPGVEGLSGRLTATDQSGKLIVHPGALEFDMPTIFRAPLHATRVSAALEWERQEDRWLIEGNDLRVAAEDGQGSGNLKLSVPFNDAVSPVLKLRVDFHDGNGAHAARYYPALHLSPEVLEWMESAFIAGRITSGYLIYDGPIHSWPFDNGEGKFELRGHVRNGVYRYLPNWMPISQAEVDVAINGSHVRVSGVGKIGALQARGVVVDVGSSSKSSQHTVRVQGEIHGRIQEALQVVLAAYPAGTAGWRAYVPEAFEAIGNGTLRLDLNKPLGQPGVQYQGSYRVAQAGLKFPGAGNLSLETLTGDVQFSDAGVNSGRLTGKFLGGNAELVATRIDNRLEIKSHGHAKLRQWLHVGAPSLAERITGDVPWWFTWNERIGMGNLRAEIDFSALKTELPTPLNRPDGLLQDKIVVQTESDLPHSQMLVIQGGPVRGQIELNRAQNVWQLSRGFIAFGVARGMPAKGSGLIAAVDIDQLDLSQWIPLFADNSGKKMKWPGSALRVTADVQHFMMFDRDFGRLQIDMKPIDKGWHATIEGATTAGSAQIATAVATPQSPKQHPERSNIQVQLDLAHLRLPESAGSSAEEPILPGKLPAVTLRSRSFEYKDKKFGALDFSAVPIDQGWRITRLNLTRPEMKLSVNGTWRAVDGRQMSDFDIAFNSEDMGKTMEAFDNRDQMTEGKVKVTAKLNWPGMPTEPQLAGLGGQMSIKAKKGRFIQLDPGAARLFGLLELKSIARYLLLDFSSVFGKGFAFDNIGGNITIEHGNAYTRDFVLNGPNAEFVIDGRTGLAAEDYDLTLGVTPKLSDTLTLTSWGLLGPQVGVAVLALQKLFKKQIEKGTRVIYTIKGPWDDPIIRKSGVAPAVVTPLSDD